MFQNKSKFQRAWEKLDKVLKPSLTISGIENYLGGYRISNTIQVQMNQSFNSSFNDNIRTLRPFSSSVQNNKRSLVQRMKSSQNKIRYDLRTLSSSFEVTSNSIVINDEIFRNKKIKIKNFKNQQQLRSIHLYKLKDLFLNKCKDNEIISTQLKFSLFLIMIYKKCSQRILDLSYLQLGFHSSPSVAHILNGDQHFLQLSLQGNNLTEGGWIKFADVLNSGFNNTILHINLSQCNMSPPSLVHVLQSFGKFLSLISLDIQSNHLSKTGSDMLQEFLSVNKTLLYLNISFTQMGHGFESVCKGLSSCKTLINLELANNDIAQKQFAIFTSYILENDNYETEFLIQLNLEKNNLNQKGAEQLALMLHWKSWKLNDLNISSNNINGKGFQKIAEALINHRFIEKINISKNNLRGTGFEYIIYLLQNNTSLRYLNFSECNLETIEAFSLGDGLNKNLSLTHLDISGNPILIKGAYAIADGIAAHKSLNILNLSRCQLKDQGASYLYKKLQNIKSLSYLILRSNFLTDDSFIYMKELLKFNKFLTKIDYSLNLVNFKLETEIISSLKDNQSYQKDLLLPKYLQTLSSYANINQQKEEIQNFQEEIKFKEEILQIQFQTAKNVQSEFKSDQKILLAQVQNKTENYQESLVELTKINENHEIEQYHWKKNNEIDKTFYENHIDEQNKLSQFYLGAIQQCTKQNREKTQAPKNLLDLEKMHTQAKYKLDQASQNYQNLQQDLQILQSKLLGSPRVKSIIISNKGVSKVKTKQKINSKVNKSE